MTESAIVAVRVTLGADGDAYYTALYANGEAGPRSEGYAGETPEKARAAAVRAAARDFPDVPVKVDR
jgi:hypothetical protein